MDERLRREADAVGRMTERLRGRIPPAPAGDAAARRRSPSVAGKPSMP